MIRIYLVGSVHEEKGLANTIELARALERFRPEVIFLEIPTSLNDDQIKYGLRETLESKSVGIYRQLHPVEVVPVDLPTPELQFFSNNSYLHKRIENTSRDYCRLIDWHSQYVERYGFAYLNSTQCDTIWNDLDREIETTILKLNEPRLIELFELWKQNIERRDVEMLNNIRRYCARSTLERAVFLVGASHRRSIKQKAESFDLTATSGIIWDFLEN